MTYAQTVAPNPNIPCKPGWCLQYVRQAYGLAGVHPTATAGWDASPTQHRDRNFPTGVWIPVWFSLANEPAGHVALMAPDGSVYSTSDLTNVPHHHPDLDDLIAYYARYGMPLGYRGWTEDIEDVAVITGAGINVEGAITTSPQEDDMPSAEEVVDELLNREITGDDGKPVRILWILKSFHGIMNAQAQNTAKAVLTTPIPNVKTGGQTTLATEIGWLPANVANLAAGHAAGTGDFDQAAFEAKLAESLHHVTDGLSITLTADGGGK